jgi:hypothetical protein|nr:hypothetical protein [Neorhizobium tomejilense]
MPHAQAADETLERIAPLALHPDPMPDPSGKLWTRNHRRLLVASLIAGLDIIASCWFWPAAFPAALFMFGLAVGTSSYVGFDIKYSAGPKYGLTPYFPEIAGVWLGFTTGGVALWEILKTLT